MNCNFRRQSTSMPVLASSRSFRPPIKASITHKPSAPTSECTVQRYRSTPELLRSPEPSKQSPEPARATLASPRLGRLTFLLFTRAINKNNPTSLAMMMTLPFASSRALGN
ncbi:hypothetical protein EJ05DRAFT_119980 [Pseudovirgaria hyperparasitica]|uniref:Uncharacterized protein n=1 Tax=Pseudovirgaria hyperparasitica TaxID=470096 RepID=A0A6A6VXY4_9PEZI|nr:uncharacterized protein EJ05DRAFT_119980 [Pseudovirgaria hyperparasitica]KAF2755045.1 hypothetical protein EJ05DRAFT_119980 [Pseudovirgaria hyperparasitica]